jgi:LAO/AO transport system kinase
LIDEPESALHVCPGLPSKTAPRPDLRIGNRRTALSPTQYIDGIRAGNRAILAQAITLIESTRLSDREFAEHIVEQCLSPTPHSLRLGITGIPGAGKSCLIEALGKYLIEDQGQNLAVLAIDPSSQRSGGSILGDKTHMGLLASRPEAFIRPSPSRGSFGGVTQHTREAMLLCEAAGYRNILVETVGVGQSETAAYDMVDFLVLVMIAGAGDELQGIKRGVMELADLVVINKADGAGLAAAERAVAEANRALHFFPASPSEWTPRAIACSAHTHRGIPELWKCVVEHAQITRTNGWFDHNRKEQRRRWMHESLEQGLKQLFSSDPLIRMRMDAFEAQVASGQTAPFRAARELLEIYARRNGSGRSDQG